MRMSMLIYSCLFAFLYVFKALRIGWKSIYARLSVKMTMWEMLCSNKS